MRKILVVDDDPAIIRLLSTVLRYESMSVVQADCGEEALDLIEQERPDVVLTDFFLPGMSGVEFCRQIKKNPRTASTPVILMTGALTRADCQQTLAEGVDGFLQKPFSIKQLLDVMAAVVADCEAVSVVSAI
jgi:two-component system phosphate regulon response regulator PhoB